MFMQWCGVVRINLSFSCIKAPSLGIKRGLGSEERKRWGDGETRR